MARRPFVFQLQIAELAALADRLERRIVGRLEARLALIEHQLARLAAGTRMIMGAQEDIDAAVAELGIDIDTLNVAAVDLAAEIARLQSQGVDTSGLLEIVNRLDAGVGSVVALVPAAPPVEPEPV